MIGLVETSSMKAANGAGMGTTSETLLERVRRPDDHAAWAQFVAIYTPLLLCWAKRLNLPRHETSDLVQEVLLLLLRKLPEFEYRRSGGFRGWLRTVAINRWRTMARGRRTEEPAGETVDEVVAPDEAERFWEAEYHQRLTQNLLQKIRADFAAPTWRAFDECVLRERSPREVAAELGLKLAQVYDAKYRVLHRLRTELRELED